MKVRAIAKTLFVYKPENLRLADLLLLSQGLGVLDVFAAFLAKQVQLPSLKEQHPDLENTQQAFWCQKNWWLKKANFEQWISSLNTSYQTTVLLNNQIMSYRMAVDEGTAQVNYSITEKVAKCNLA